MSLRNIISRDARRFGRACAHTLCLLLTAVVAASQAVAAPVRVTTIEGRSLEAEWRGVNPAGDVVLNVEGQEQAFPAGSLMGLRWDAPTTSQPVTSDFPIVIYLADGSRFAAKITGSGPKHVSVATPLLPALDVPFAQMAAIAFEAARDEDQAPIEAALRERHASEDTLLIRREGRMTPLRGVVESITPEGGSFTWRGRGVPMRRDVTFALIFAAGVARHEPAPVNVLLRDGSKWAGTLAGGDAEQIRLKSSLGQTLAIPLGQAAEIRFRSDRVMFLSDLEPVNYIFEPFGVTHWPYRRDRSVSNRPLRIGDQSYERGIGVHSRSVLVYDVPEGFTQLAAVIGIDSAVRPRGSVVFQVLAGERELFNSGPVRGTDPPRPILVELGGARQIALVVDFGEELDIADHANWANARLVR